MTILIIKETVHFDDRPYSVKAYGYENGRRFNIIIPEDYVFNKTGVDELENSDLTKWVLKNLDDIQRICNDMKGAYVKRRAVFDKNISTFPDDYTIIIS